MLTDLQLLTPGLTVYPNPTDGIIHLKFRDIQTNPVRFDIFNSKGEKVYSDLTEKTGTFTIEADLSGFPPGAYIVRYSQSEKPVIVIINEVIVFFKS